MKTREVNKASAQAPVILPSSARQNAQANNHHAYWSHKDTFPEHLRPIAKRPYCLQWKSSPLVAGGQMMIYGRLLERHLEHFGVLGPSSARPRELAQARD